MINVYHFYENLFHQEPYLSKGKRFARSNRKTRIEIECGALERYQKEQDQEAGLEIILYGWGILVRECTRLLKAFAYPGISMDDILQEAICAYLAAAQKFTCTGRARFVYYAIQYTRAFLHKYLRTTIKPITIPQNNYKTRNFQIEEVRSEIELIHRGYNPEEEWIENIDRGLGRHEKDEKASKPRKPNADKPKRIRRST